VNVITVAAQPVLYYDKYPATTQALSQVTITPEVQGYITGIYFTEGANVRKGQLLYTIDQRLYQAAYDQAVANVKVAEGTQTQAQQDADRYAYLNSYNAVAKQQYDHAVITLQNAKSSVEAANEAVKSAKANLAYSSITAPFDGTIGFSQVKLGNMVTVGQTVLNTISTNNPMAVDFLINEKQLTAFEKLQKEKQQSLDSLFTILLPDNTMYPYIGKISVIDRAVDAQTGAIRVRLEFPNPNSDLRVGMSCVVRVHNQETTPQILIPGKAVVEQMGEYFVFVVKDTIMPTAADSTKKKDPETGEKKEMPKDKKDPKAEKEEQAAGPSPHAFQKKVIPGQTIGANVIIKSGLSEGERLVIDGVQLLHDGSKVALGKKPEASDKAGAGDSTNNADGANNAKKDDYKTDSGSPSSSK
jgi:membrane fusion protein (multidrug efflux system)